MTKLGIAPSEFWRLKPRHFWVLLRTLNPDAAKPGLKRSERNEMLALLEKAERGEF